MSSLELIDDRPVDLVAKVLHSAPGKDGFFSFFGSTIKQCGKVLLSVGQDNRLLIVGKLALGLCVDSDLEILSAVIEII